MLIIFEINCLLRFIVCFLSVAIYSVKIVCLGAAAAGTGLSWTSPVGDQLQVKNTTNNHSQAEDLIRATVPVLQVTGEQFTWVASLLAIGAIVGAVPSGILADKIGRKKAAILISIPYIISYLMTVFAKNVEMLYFARFLIGKRTSLIENNVSLAIGNWHNGHEWVKLELYFS